MAKSVKADFGATGDGITDDTAALNAAIAYGYQNQESVFIPAGVYMHSGLIVYPYTRIYGEGRLTKLSLIASCNNDSIKGVNSDLWWGMTSHSTPTNTCYYVEISDIVIDGGVTNFQEGNAGSGISIWGSRLRIHNVDIENCAEHGIHTDYYDNNYDASLPWYESSFYSIRIFNCGKHGWLCAGPHDLQATDITIIDGSRNGNALYDGLYVTPNCSANFTGLHVSNAMSDTIRHRFAGNIQGPCRFSGGNTFEGAYTANMYLKASNCQFSTDSTWYAPWNGRNIMIAGSSAFNIIRGLIGGAPSGKPSPWGIRFVDFDTTKISANNIDVLMTGQNTGLISFGTSTTSVDGDGGKNIINIQSYNNAGVGCYGVPNTASGTVLRVHKNSVGSIIDSEYQTKTIYVGPQSTTTWTFDFPFPDEPSIRVDYRSPSQTPNGFIFVSAATSTQAIIKNTNNFGVNVYASASINRINAS